MKKAILLACAVALASSCKNQDKEDEVTPKTVSPYYFNAKAGGTSLNRQDGVGSYKIFDYTDVEVDEISGGFDVEYQFEIFDQFNSLGKGVLLNYRNHIDDSNDADDMLSFFEVGIDTLSEASTNGSNWNLSYRDGSGNLASSLFGTDSDVTITISEVTDLGNQKISSIMTNMNGTTRRVIMIKGTIQDCSLTGEVDVDLTDIEFTGRFVSTKTF
jgi:hypothetical protein